MEMFDTPDTAKQSVYTSLANKYRPQTFEEVVGQESVSKTIMNAVKSSRVAHAYLFYGPRGCGKTTTARLLAKALNCTGNGNTKPTASPCGKCPQCLEIASSSDMDVLELDAASNTQVERVREAIIDTVALAAGRDRYKVFILDEVHMLSTSSFNALLKTIEEPPSHVVFILATTELHKVPLTISSRCQTFRFKPITEEQISSHLMDLAGAENIELEEEAAKIIAKGAGGALRDALTIFDRAISFSDGKVDKVLVSEMLGILPNDLIQNALLALVNKDSAALHKVFETVQSEGFDALGLVKDLKNTLGEVFYFSLGAGKEPFVGAKDALKDISPAYLASLTRKLSKLIDEVKYSDTPALLAEVGLFSIMENTVDIDNFVSRLEALEASLSSDDSGEKKTLNKISPAKPAKKADAKPVVEEESQPPVPQEEDFYPELAKKITVKQEVAEVKEEEKEESSTAPVNIEDCRAMWEKFKKGLSSNYPFLYELVVDLPICFDDGNVWSLKIKGSDDFLKSTLQRRMSDFESLALKLFSVKIRFKIISDGTAAKAEVKPAAAPAFKKYSAPAGVRKVENGSTSVTFYQSAVPTAKAAAQPVKAAAAIPQEAQTISPISAEEPFVAGDYSADILPKPAAVKQTVTASAAAVSSAAKQILDIFEGQVVESI